MAGSGRVISDRSVVRSFGSFAVAGPLIAMLLLVGTVFAQGRAGGQAPQSTGRAGAIKDLTGYWVSVVAEHWHLRMMVPPKGDFSMVPLNAEARRIAGAREPAKEEPGAAPCKSYGAATIMRVPSRLHIEWADDNTLKMDIDSGTQ